jgi:selenide,water dikinase
MARGSNVAFVVNAQDVPLLPQATALAKAGHVTGASTRNWASYKNDVTFPPTVAEWQRHLFTDPQTSGGLLIACRSDRAKAIQQEIVAAGYPFARIIGRAADGPATIRIEV